MRFNSRSPSGLRPAVAPIPATNSGFQFTQPKRAATATPPSSNLGAAFQFTQPKRAATQTAKRAVGQGRRFNSRSPSGLRPACIALVVLKYKFQFTQPKRAATYLSSPSGGNCTFQFTQPKRAATREVLQRKTSLSRFNSRSPSGLRPAARVEPPPDVPFQFTQPKRAATNSFE